MKGGSTVSSTFGTSRRIAVGVRVAVLVCAAFIVSHPAPASAATRYAISSANTTLLKGFPSTAYTKNGYLKWSPGYKLASRFTEYKKTRDGVYCYQVGNGQCAITAQGLASKTVTTSYWRKGTRVTSVSTVPVGTIIATFNSSGRYSGHSAIFAGYVSGGFMVWDSNFDTNISVGDPIRKHKFLKTGSGLSDADNYYVVVY